MGIVKFFRWFSSKQRFYRELTFALDRDTISMKMKKLFFPDMPMAASMEEWDKFHTDWAKEKPIMYYICFDLPLVMHRVYDFLWRTPYNFVYYRIFDKYHIINTKLMPGYHDLDERMFHGCFALLVEYVETEKAYEQYGADLYETDKSKNIFLSRFAGFKAKYFSKPKFPNRELGVRALNAEIEMADPNHHTYNPSQGDAAKEILELYIWWKDIRPERISPWSLDLEPADGYSRVASDIRADLEQDYDNEDDKMINRLIKIRRFMWT